MRGTAGETRITATAVASSVVLAVGKRLFDCFSETSSSDARIRRSPDGAGSYNEATPDVVHVGWGSVPRSPGGGPAELAGLPLHLTVQKREIDVFSRPDTAELISLYNKGAPTFVVYGVATDYCVSAAVKGLLSLSCRVAIVADAVRPIDAAIEPAVLTDLVNRGACLTITDVVCGPT